MVKRGRVRQTPWFSIHICWSSTRQKKSKSPECCKPTWQQTQILILSPLVSRWVRSTCWPLSAESSTSWWWCCPWCPATCCAGCPTASWPWWPPSVGWNWSVPWPVWCPRSWPSSAPSSTLWSTCSSTTRWEKGGVHHTGWQAPV